MKSYTDNTLISKIINDNNNEALLELANRHKGLFEQKLRKYAHLINANDFRDEFLLIIFDIVKDYVRKTRYCQFNTFFGNSVRFKCLKLVHQKAKLEYKCTSQIDEEHLEENKTDTTCLNFKAVLKELKALPDKRIRKIFSLRYGYNRKRMKSLKDIGQQMKTPISTEWVRILHNRGLQHLQNKNLDLFVQ